MIKTLSSLKSWLIGIGILSFVGLISHTSSSTAPQKIVPVSPDPIVQKQTTIPSPVLVASPIPSVEPAIVASPSAKHFLDVGKVINAGYSYADVIQYLGKQKNIFPINVPIPDNLTDPKTQSYIQKERQAGYTDDQIYLVINFLGEKNSSPSPRVDYQTRYIAPVPSPQSDSYIWASPSPTVIEPRKNVSCTQSGNWTYCDDGRSYMTQQSSGNADSYSTLGSDGSYTTTNGNFTYGSGGSAIRSGNFTYGSDGTTCSKIGNIINCN